ncbi:MULTISPECIES: tyrosine-type recombinase/integrase [unclassified Nocardioides]|uniref:tyrosine-type recombinase/integrase n=1 Tax=unclassified Nocardioides TaxID=2615069 RepID=UPI0036197A47
MTASPSGGRHDHPGAGRVTFRAYAEEWRLMRLHRPSSTAHVETMLRRHVYPTLGGRRLDEIVHSDIQSWVQMMSVTNGLAASTVRVVHGIVSSIFLAAIRDRRLVTNPCEGTRLPLRERRLVVPLRTEQVARLRDEVPGELRALVTFAAGTGMRQGEVFGLTRDRLRLDTSDPVVIVDRQLRTLPGPTTAFGPLKTVASRRIVPLPQVVVEALERHLCAREVAEEGLVFTLGGEPIVRSAFGHVWRPAARAAGLNELTGTGMHALRHYYASLLIRYGESARTVQARLGHASPSETLETYAHLWHDSDDRTRLAVDAELGAR